MRSHQALPELAVIWNEEMEQLVNDFVIQDSVFALLFTELHTVADAWCFRQSSVSQHYVALRDFAAKNPETVENDRENHSFSSSQNFKG
jgi:hypothetical protein